MKQWFKKALFPASAFVAGFSLMVMELTASRVLAPIFGASLYTWTAVIGIIMLGLAGGNFIGGYYIDKKTSTKTIFVFFILSALSVFLIPLAASFSRSIVLWEIPLPLIITLITFLIFFVPSLFMGCIYPCIFKFHLKEFAAIGKSAGRISAFWTLGSILGTFLTGFVFVSFWGSANTLWAIAILLLLNGILIYFPSRKNVFWLVIFFSALAFWARDSKSVASPKGDIVFEKESAYYSIKVVDVKNKPPYGNARFMFLDFDSHGVDGSGIKKLNLYTNVYPVFSAIKDPIKNILVLGGGPGTITRNFSAYYQEAQVTNVEIDPQVSRAARDFFPKAAHEIKDETADGRVFLQKKSATYDLIFNDTYNSFISVPWHLATQEFNDLAWSRLNDGGIYAVNFISTREGEESLFFQSMLKTFRQTFPNYSIFAFNSNPKKVQNIILVGVRAENYPERDLLANKIGSLENGQLLEKNLISSPEESEEAVILRDDFAPTEKLMTPIINSYFTLFSSFYYSIF